jgi:hypothetical protein
MKPRRRGDPAELFVEDMLAWIRREFFRLASDKKFFQEREILVQAITWPARYINDRGAKLQATDYRRIIGTVIDAIRRHGKLSKIARFSAYFLYSVQQHMIHHGEEYYMAAKAAKPIGAILPRVAARLRSNGPPPDRSTETLAALNRLLRSKGGRRRRDSGSDSGDLFSQCARPAAAVQKG